MILKKIDMKKTKNIKEENGLKNEIDAAYHIDFYFKNQKNTYVFHDITLVYNDRKVQIDHMVIKPAAIYLFESKSFNGTLEINENNWIVKYKNGKTYSIKSPIQQNKRHIDLLKEIIKNRFKTTPPSIENIILVANKTIIKGDIPWNVVKNDQIETIHKQSKIKSIINPAKLFYNKILSDKKTEELAYEILNMVKENNNKKNIPTKNNIETLKEIRLNIANKEKKKAFQIFTNETLKEIAEKKPKTKEDFLKIKGIGENKYAKYGKDFSIF